MSHMASGILGTVAAALTLGAVHLEVAAGNDLLGPILSGDASLSSTGPNVNRSVKGDRQTAVTSNDGVTISYMVPGKSDLSVAMRVPVSEAGLNRRAPATAKNDAFKRQKIACESTVSQMSPVAKQLEPGRCVT